MTHKGNGHDWELQINALLDGELDEATTAALKQAASEDHVLARTIIEAYELQRNMDRIGIEKAPASLSRRLKNIPREQRRSASRPRWTVFAAAGATAMALIPVLVIGIVSMLPQQPSAAEVERARQERAVAFSYLDKISDRAGGHINSLLGTELRSCVTENISTHIPYTESSRKEKSI